MMKTYGNRIGWGVFVCICVAAPGILIANEAVAATGWLRLFGGDHVSGTLVERSVDGDAANETGTESETSVTFDWQHPSFAEPFRFELHRIRDAAFSPDEEFDPVAGTFLFELIDGDRLIGEVHAVKDDMIEIDAVAFGHVEVKRDRIVQISKRDEREHLYYVGPSKLDNWIRGIDQREWVDRGGQLSTRANHASVFRDGILPPQASIEIELSWEQPPNFVLALGVGGENIAQSIRTAFRIEVWDDQIVVLRETDDAAIVRTLTSVTECAGLLKLHLDLDQETGALSVTVGDRKAAVEVLLPPDKQSRLHDGVNLMNLSGDVSLDSIHVSPRIRSGAEQSADDEVVSLVDGSSVVGRFSGVDDQGWIFTADKEERRIDIDQIISLRFASSSFASDTETDDPADDDVPRFRVVSHFGSQMTGTWQAITDGRLGLTPSSTSQPVSIGNTHISRISRIGTTKTPSDLPAISAAGLIGRLEMADGKLTGRLVASSADAAPTPIRFQPVGSEPVTATTEFSGCLYFREPPTAAQLAAAKKQEARERQQRLARERAAAQRPAANFGIMDVFNRAFDNIASAATNKTKSLQLRSGETIPCEITSIDDQGIVFQSDVTKETRLPHEPILAVRLVMNSAEPVIDPVVRERLMTVPRIGKKNPPTHLIVGANGDLLRCRLLRLTEHVAQVETRLETIEIDRSLIAEIIWLEKSGDEPSADGDKDAEESVLNVRAKLRNGNQLSLVPQRVSETAIHGTHPYLGDSEITINEADQLVFGTYVSQTDHETFEQQWLLRDAPEPMIGDDESGGRIPGTASLLVGTPAPDFTLDLLGGGRFQVSESKGKILVLDFWATWCGPCLQAMPVIDATVAEFDEADVMLVSVNLQETAEPIESTLERLKLSPRVALDIDGVAAARYQADAIPQTVVIDRQGQIARVFVGSGRDLGQQLSDAIEELLAKD